MRTKLVECWIFRQRDHDLEFLLLHRTPQKGGFWQPPCGGIETDDSTILEGALRELREEVSIDKKQIKRVLENVFYFTIDKHYLTGNPITPQEEFVLGFEVDQDCPISISHNIDKEHDCFKWVNFDKALQLLKWENNKDALKKLHDLLMHKPS